MYCTATNLRLMGGINAKTSNKPTSRCRLSRAIGYFERVSILQLNRGVYEHAISLFKSALVYLHGKRDRVTCGDV